MAWLSGWTYRKLITISGVSGIGTNYPVLLKVGESSGSTGADFHLEGHSDIFPQDNNSGDLRFTLSDGTTKLPFYVEKVVGTAPNRVAYVWVKITQDLSTDVQIYCYYGNVDATNVSDGASVFPFYDDMETWAWSDVSSSTTGTILQDSTVRRTGNYSAKKDKANHPYGGQRSLGTTFGRDISLEGWVFRPTSYAGGDYEIIEIGDSNWSTGRNTYGFRRYAPGGNLNYGIDVVTGGTVVANKVTGPNLSNGFWYRFALRIWSSGTVEIEVWDSDYNSQLTYSLSDSSFNSFDTVYILGGYEYYVDDLFVRIISATEPSVSTVGAEEATASGTGWLSGWQYRKKITLNGSPGAGSGYTIVLNVGESSGSTGADFHLEGNSAKFPTGLKDGGDLRFTDSNGTTLLPFFVEKVTGTAPNRVAKVWVKVIGSLDGSRDIYVYYGNSSATNAGNDPNAFLLYDDFESGVIDTNKWTVTEYVTQTGYIDVTNTVPYEGTYSLDIADASTAGSSRRAIHSDVGVTDYFVRVFIYSDPQADDIKHHGQLIRVGSNGSDDLFAGVLNNGGTDDPMLVIINQYATQLSTPVSITNWPKRQWMILEVVRTYDSSTGKIYADVTLKYADETVFASATGLSANCDSNFTVCGLEAEMGSGQTGHMYFDLLMVKKYVSPEPSISAVGAQEVAQATVPDPPQNVSASHGDTEIYLTWDPPANNGGSPITGYNIYRGTSSGGETLLTSVNDVTTSYTDTGLTNGTTYYYYVTAVNSVGESSPSTEVSATPSTIPSAPQNLTATAGDGQVSLSWDPPANDGGAAVTEYRIYRGTTSGGETFLTSVTSTSYTDTGLTNGTTYYYYVTAVNLNGESGASNEVSATPVGPPGAPQNVTATHGDQQVTLSWTAPADDGGSSVTEYRVYRGTTSGGETYLATVLAPNTSYTDSGLTNGTTYYYYVTAVNSVGEGPASTEVSATPSTVPSPPQNVTATHGDSQATISWSPPADDGGSAITGYKLYRGTTSGGESWLVSLSPSTTSYTDTGLANGTTYYYYVVATNINGDSSPSNEVSVTPSTTPGAPQNLSASSGDSQITLTWDPPADDGGAAITEYRIYRGTSSGNEALLTSTTSTTYTDTGLTNGTTYYYYVTAVNLNGEGPASTEVSATPKGPPTAPQNLTATAGDGTVDLSWSPPSNDGGSAITAYNIYRGTTSGGEVFLASVSGSTTTYTDTGLTNGTTYYYYVTAKNALGESPASNEVSATPTGPPDPPQNVTASPGDAQVTLTWDPPASNGGSAITGYKIYRGTTSGGETYLASVGSSTTSYTDTGLTNGTTYYYYITAVNANGESSPSAEVSATPSTIPGAPQNLTATHGDTQATLSWSAPADDGGSPITGYNIYRGTSSGGETLLTSVGATTTSYTDTGLTNGTTYYYYVTATNANGEGPASNEVSVTPSTTPGAPQNLTATAGDAQVTLNWSAPADDGGASVTQYKIYRGTTSGGETYLATVTAPTTTYTDTGLTNGTTYYYYVTAVNLNGEGPASTEVSATPTGLPSEPQNVTATHGDGQITLSWSAPADDGGTPITGYNIYRGTTSGGETLLTSVDASTTTYTDTGLTNGTTYYYYITATNANGEGPASVEVSETPSTIPTAPQNLTATHGDGQITLNWSAPADNGGASVTQYNIYRGTSSGGETFLASVTAPTTTYTDTGLTNGTTYYYYVTAVNLNGESPASNEVSATPSTTPGAPQNVSATGGDGVVTLSWSAPADDGGAPVTEYRVYRGTTSGGETFLASTTGTSYSDTSVTNGTTYYYYVTAVNLNGEGPASTEVSATPLGTPFAPQNLTATAGDSQVSLSWTAPADDGGSAVTGYNVYRGTTSGGETLLVSLGNVTSYTDTSVTNGTTYYYYVTAVNSVGEGAASAEVSATPQGPPTAPQNLSATAGNGQVTLTWDPPANDGGDPLTGYNIYRGTTSGGETLLTSVSATTTSYTDTGLTNGTTYYYYVTATNSLGESPASTEVSATPSAVPGPPQNLSASSGDSFVDLSWSAPADDGGSPITGYRIYKGTSSGGETFLVEVSSTTTTYHDTSVTNGTTYYYYVTAVNANGESSASNEVSATPSTIPTAPQNVTATPGDWQVDLSWSAPADDGGSAITEYRIYRGTSSGGETYLASVTAPTTTYTDTSVTNGVTYYYYVTAVNANGESPASTEVSATPQGPPTPPQNLTATGGDSQVSLSWSAPSNDGGSAVTEYRVYRGTSSGGETFLASTTSTSYTDTSVTNGTTYYYYVTAVNTLGESSPSNEVSVTPQGPPTAPQNLTATAGNQQVTLSWDPPANDGGASITEYKIYRGTSSGGETYLATVTAPTTTYTDTGLTNGTTYYYYVTAVNALGESPASTEVSATPSGIPSAPQNLTATPGDTQVTLNWAAPADDGGSAITEYRIYRGTTSGGETYLATVTAPTTSYTDTGLTNGTTYYYYVTAVNANGEGPASAEVSATPRTVPSPPQNLTATHGNQQVTLSWSAPADDGGAPITGYSIYRGTTSGGETKIASVGSTVTSYTDTGLTNGTTYYYYVTATNEAGESSPSNEVSATPSTTPGAPQNLTATAGDAQVSLSWSAPADDGGAAVTQYNIYRGTTSGSLSFLTSVTTTTYTDTGLTNGTTYYYQVAAVNVNGEGPLSTEVSATPTGLPSAPQNLTATPGNQQVSLSWSAPADDGGLAITEYRIYRGTTSGGETYLASTTTTSYTDTGLTNGTTYYYYVTAVNANGEGPASSEVSATPSTVPTAPQNLTASAGDSFVDLSWSAPADDGGSAITGYRIYKGTSSGGETFLVSVAPSVTSYTDHSVSNGTTYYYYVTAENANGESSPSNEVSATPSTIPSSPQNVTATPGNQQVVLSWSAPASDGGSPITGYNIYRGTTSGGETLLTSVADTVTSYTDTGLTNGTTYYYYVTAVNANGESPASTEVSATPSTIPGAPQNLTATHGDSQITLSWSPPADDGGSAITEYRIYRGTTSGSETFLASTAGTTYTDTGLTNGTTYYYYVTAVNANGEGPSSTEVSATPSTTPSAPQNLTATAGDSYVDLSWSAPADDGGASITEYRIYRGTSSGGETFLASTTSTSYSDTTVTNGTTYYYYVTAVNLNGEGPASNEVSATPDIIVTVPSPPQNLAATHGNTQVDLSWSPPSNDGGDPLTAYRIYRGTSSGGETLLTSVGPTTTTYTDTGLTNGTTYYYYVTAVNSVGESSPSNEVSATPSTVPGAPQNLSATAGDSQVILRWEPPVDDGGLPITGYAIYRGTTPGGEVWITSVPATTTEFTDTGLTNGTTYYYFVRAININGEGATPTEVSATPYGLPDPPQNLTSSSGDSFVYLSWTAPADTGGYPLKYYNIYRGGQDKQVLYATVPATTTDFTDYAVSNGTTYYYYVTSVTEIGESQPSAVVSETPSTTPDAPENFSASPGDGQVVLSWNPPSWDGGSAITEYRIYRGTSPDLMSLLVSVDSSITTYTDLSVVNGTTYYYYVTAVNVRGEGTSTSILSATPEFTPVIPGAPQNLTAVGGDSVVFLSWDPPIDDGGSAIVGYRIYRDGSLLTSVWMSTSYVDVGVSNGVLYSYYVTAVNSVGESVPSNTATATPATVPYPPRNLTATAGDGQVVLSWEEPISDGGSAITGYNVYRNGYLLTTVSNTTTTYTDTTVVNGQQYEYWVRAVNNVGESSSTPHVFATPSALPTSPQNLTATSGDEYVDLDWDPPADDGGLQILLYRIYRGTTQGQETVFAVVPGNRTHYRDLEVTPNTTYYYYVTAVNANGESSPSNTSSATPTAITTPITGVPPSRILYTPDGPVVSVSFQYTDGYTYILSRRLTEDMEDWAESEWQVDGVYDPDGNLVFYRGRGFRAKTHFSFPPQKTVVITQAIITYAEQQAADKGLLPPIRIPLRTLGR